jgi:hypothetical protein
MGAATLWWIPQCLHHKTDFPLISFPLIQKPTIQNIKNIQNINLYVIFSFFHRAVEKHEHYVTYFLSSANIVL